MAGIKIVDLPPLGRDLASTDLLELSLAGGTGSRKITGQEIMNASKLSINNTPIINGTVGRVLFQGTGNVLQQSSSLFWDATNNRLGIGTSSPAYTFDVNGNIAVNNSVYVYSTAYSSYTRALYDDGSLSTILRGNTHLDFWSANNFRMRVNNSGNVLINTTTDAGFRLDVNGTFRALVSTETNPFVVQHTNGNSATIIIGNGSQLAAGQMGMYFNSSPIWTWNGSAFRLPGNIISTQNNPSTLLISGGWGGSTVGTSLRLSSNTGNQGVFTATSGTQSTVEIGNTSNETWSPSSGNATYNLLSVVPRINTTGTYSGIVRGIIYAPTLTSVTGVTHRAIDLTSGDFVWGTGYSQYYGNSVEGFIQFNISGSTTQMWMRPPNNPNNYGPSYYSKISQTNADLTINSGQYGSLYLGANGSNGANASMVLFNASANTLCNVLIGTTTNAGYRLDVNGTARVNGNLTFAFSTTYITTSNTGGGISAGVNTFMNNGATWVDDTSVRALDITYANGIKIANTTRYPLSLGTSAKAVASAQLEMVSTTQGFLPPRMTQAQRNAIPSPAIGLEIYQTDATEGKYIYKSSGWTYIG